MEKLFKARWWDYHNRKFNINGRVCLETLLPFGIAGTVLLKWINPFVLGLLEKAPSIVLKWVLVILITITAIDTIISFIVIGNFKRTAKQVEKEVTKDDTEEISNMVKEVTTQKAEEIKGTIQLNVRMAGEKVHYTGEKVYQNLMDSEKKLIQTRDRAIAIIKEKVEKSQNDIRTAIQERITTTKEFTDAVKERFASTWLNRRFLRAFPNLQAKS